MTTDPVISVELVNDTTLDEVAPIDYLPENVHQRVELLLILWVFILPVS